MSDIYTQKKLKKERKMMKNYNTVLSLIDSLD